MTQQENTQQTKAETFREKVAKGTAVCFNQQCPRYGRCLRADLAPYADSSQRVVASINPRYTHAADGQCDMFMDNTLVKMPVGMTKHFFYDMPARIAKAIRRRLIADSCRYTYYKYHNGEVPITPQRLKTIERICREEGWTAPLVFDGEVEDYVW